MECHWAWNCHYSCSDNEKLCEADVSIWYFTGASIHAEYAFNKYILRPTIQLVIRSAPEKVCFSCWKLTFILKFSNLHLQLRDFIREQSIPSVGSLWKIQLTFRVIKLTLRVKYGSADDWIYLNKCFASYSHFHFKVIWHDFWTWWHFDNIFPFIVNANDTTEMKHQKFQLKSQYSRNNVFLVCSYCVEDWGIHGTWTRTEV